MQLRLGFIGCGGIVRSHLEHGFKDFPKLLHGQAGVQGCLTACGQQPGTMFCILLLYQGNNPWRIGKLR